MSMFKVGDKVRITKEFQGMALVGALAEVVNFEDGWYGLDIDGWAGGHDCDALYEGCKSGWWIKEGYFEKVSTFRGNK